MFLDNLFPGYLGALAAPASFLKRLRHRKLVSFGLLANLQAMQKKSVIADIDAIIDVGANQGQFAFMAHSIWPEIPIYSFEPDPENFVILQQHFSKYSITGQPLNMALGSEQATLPLHRYENHVNNSFLTREEINHTSQPFEKVNVTCTTLDAISASLPKINAAFLKLDVQGFELAVLKGSVNFLQHCRYVLAEVSFTSSYTNGAHADEVMLALRTYGFECIQLLDILRDKKSGHILEADMLFINKQWVRNEN